MGGFFGAGGKRRADVIGEMLRLSNVPEYKNAFFEPIAFPTSEMYLDNSFLWIILSALRKKGLQGINIYIYIAIRYVDHSIPTSIHITVITRDHQNHLTAKTTGGSKEV
jgi:hypothetical protein